MKNYVLLFTIFLLPAFLFSNLNIDQTEEEKAALSGEEVLIDGEGLKLLETYCYSCHNPASTSHDEILAPPMAGIQRRYRKTFATQKEFVDRIVTFASNPTDEKAIFTGPVRRFGLMPKAPASEEELQIIAAYLYENDVAEPVWFEEHHQQKHGKGKGRHN